ncbi:MAG TPA: ABC transporter ATP-binding protein [Spirochaetota bacterium]|nr:ABC transporter ATP-binding protein [Spirochaetota bacterium]HPC41536.1 ABC transporter ATP-binding protein [Spirochaetota bacterium]HPL15576.1 ABC transporter ATP-binding protein [Spirochaetota bacterium]HQF09095.1 ABC transporter ATP-binding protein [Spirochaetota bacterium]HQH97680.1 ABC transporter ATP-binding protein [Spirochaetota bacterium]
MLKIRNLYSGFGNLRVLKGVSLHVNPGEIVTIIGGNGSGKSTLLSTIAGIVPALEGEIIFNDENVAGKAPEKIVAAGCSLVPEGRLIFNTLTVRENLVMGAYTRIRGDRGINLGDELAVIFGMFPRLQEREHQLGGTLSGGEQQMLAIGRALMAKPRLIMLDEPSMGLAPIIVKGIFEEIRKLRDAGNTILLVEQNARAALRIADRGYVIETGQMVLEGTSEELLNNNDVQRAYLGKDYRSISD